MSCSVLDLFGVLCRIHQNIELLGRFSGFRWGAKKTTHSEGSLIAMIASTPNRAFGRPKKCFALRAYAGVIFKDLRRAVPYASRGDADGHSWADGGAGCELLNRFGTLSTQRNLSGINRDKVNYYFQSLKPALLSI